MDTLIKYNSTATNNWTNVELPLKRTASASSNTNGPQQQRSKITRKQQLNTTPNRSAHAAKWE